MPSAIQTSFIGGEWAPEYDGRVDLPLYRHALSLGRNMVLQGAAGGMTMRPGFRLVAGAKDGAAYKVRLLKFNPATATQYTLEFGDEYIRFYRKKAQIQSGGSAYQVTTPYPASALAGLSFTSYQSQLYIWHPSYPPQVLTWSGDTSWAIAAYTPYDGPYLDAIGQTTTATPGAVGSAATITLNNTTEVNGGAGFQASDVGRQVRFQVPVWALTVNGNIANSGGSYNIGDTIIPQLGTPLMPQSGQLTAELTVTAVQTGGHLQNVAITDPGQYLLPPPSTFVQGYTSGNGNSAAFNSMVFTQTQPDSSAPNPLVWLPGTITAVASTTQCSVSLGLMQLDAEGTLQQAQFPSTAAITSWRLGAWCAEAGYPGCGYVFQSRLCASGWPLKPKRVFGSCSGGILTQAGAAPTGFASMSPSLATGQVIDSNAIEYDLDDDIGGSVEWMQSAGSAQIPQLAVGSRDAEFILQGANAGTLSPTSVQVYRETRYGAAAVPPLKIGRALVFAERGGKKLRQWMYEFLAAGYVGPDLAPNSHHLITGGVARMDYAQVPYPVIWLATNDGNLASVSFQLDEKEPSDNFAAANSHQLGGSYYGAAPQVTDLCVVPSEDDSYDEVWIAVLRTDTGTAEQTIEVSDPYFRDKPLDQACFMDGALSSALTYPNATCTLGGGPYNSGQSLPVRGDSLAVAFGANVASSGDTDPGTVLRVNNGTFLVTGYTSPTAITVLCLDTPANLAPAAANAWSYTARGTSFGGFAALAGATVGILADGSYLGTAVVPNGGTVTIATPASYVTIGRLYVGQLATLDLDLPVPDGAAGASQMKMGRMDHLYARFFQSQGCEYGIVHDDGDFELDALETQQSGQLAGWAPQVITEDKRLPLPGGSTMRRRAVIQQATPWPLTVSALVVKGGVGSTEISPR